MTLPVQTKIAEDLDPQALLSTLEALHPLIIVGDPNLQAAWMSEACIALCADGKAFLGKPIADFLAELGDGSHQASLRRSLDGLNLEPISQGQKVDSRLDLGDREGSPCHLDLLVFGLMAKSEPVASLWILSIVSEGEARPRPEGPENWVSAELSQLFHDLRSPLASSLGFVRLLAKDYGGVLGEEGRHFAERTEQGVRAISELLDDFLERPARSDIEGRDGVADRQE